MNSWIEGLGDGAFKTKEQGARMAEIVCFKLTNRATACWEGDRQVALNFKEGIYFLMRDQGMLCGPCILGSPWLADPDLDMTGQEGLHNLELVFIDWDDLEVDIRQGYSKFAYLCLAGEV